MPRRICPHRRGRGSHDHPSRRSERWFTSSESSRSTRIASSYAGDQPQHLEPQVYAVLCHLVEHRDRLVTSQEMMKHVWGDRFVTPGTLNSRIKALRQALGDDGTTQRVIQTVHGRGFRLQVDVREVADTEAGDHDSAEQWDPSPPRQQIHFCRAEDGVRIAYAV